MTKNSFVAEVTFNQREFGSFMVKCSANLYSHGKMKQNCVKKSKNETKL